MIEIPIPSNNKPFKVIMDVRALSPVKIGIVADDVFHPNSCYIRRKISFKQDSMRNGNDYRKVILKFPISPRETSLKLFNTRTKDDQDFEIEGFDIKPMDQGSIWADQETHEFIPFAQDFCQKAGYINTGFYVSPNYKFLIHYLPQITNLRGKKLVTPARTHRITGRHQVSQEMFRNFTVPIRFFIMLHERMHFSIPTRKEKPADLEALQIYLDLGFPTIEAVYAATKVFKAHPESIGDMHIKRTEDILQFIDQYKKKQAIKKEKEQRAA